MPAGRSRRSSITCLVNLCQETVSRRNKSIQCRRTSLTSTPGPTWGGICLPALRFRKTTRTRGIASNGFYVFVPFPMSNAIAGLLIGAPVVFLQAGGELPRGLRSHDFSVYGQDEYKLSPRFTLNLGLCYQINTPYTEVNNRLASARASSLRSSLMPPWVWFILATPVFRTAWCQPIRRGFHHGSG